ncbi:MAG: cell wall-binding repeat-containing protein [Peptostreptococcus porci]|uniref:cell wall-binding repeat-containing protein n=1 Tax=Peptostreptococcus porci TaxID=2652282 RepID=UPI002A7FCA09|nr:cell wall-binding repeat-containing protein [Peptostreptococcus porci]MDY4129087.1 cell wall-binding repeat-containing protein [Peptostreptococcus porci]MDY4561629.1 cell wall-binding repeat-containing protein [Peptostreptococcus porci]
MKTSRRISIILGLTMLFSSIITPVYGLETNKNNENVAFESTNAREKTEINVTRISGNDRYDTSVEIAKVIASTYNESDNKVSVFASGESFSDSLSAGCLASEYNAPLLLVKKNEITGSVREFYSKYLKYDTFLVGGKNTISENVEKQIKKDLLTEIASFERLSDKNRFDTAIKVFQQILTKRRIIAVGDVSNLYNPDQFSDALTATPFLYQRSKNGNVEILLPNFPERIISVDTVFGGIDSVPTPKLGKEKLRLAGEDRYKTAVEVAKAYKTMLNMDIDTVVITSGEDYPDALCAGPLASNKKAAILLTNSKKLNVDTKEYIKSNPNIKNIIIVGGENSVSKDVEQELLDIRK